MRAEEFWFIIIKLFKIIKSIKLFQDRSNVITFLISVLLYGAYTDKNYFYNKKSLKECVG